MSRRGDPLWDTGFAGQVANSDSVAAIAVVRDIAGQSPALSLLRYIAQGWQVIPIPRTEGAGGSCTALRGSTVYVAYTAAVDGAGRDMNSVFLVASDDLGQSWSPPRLISQSGEFPAGPLRLLVSGDSDLHLVWEQWTGGSTFVVRHRQSRDGVAWSQASDLKLSGSFGNPQIILDRRGRLHLIHEDYPNGGEQGGLMTAIHADRWSEPAPLFPGFRALDPFVTAMADGTLALAFLSPGHGMDASSGQRTYLSFYR